MSKVVLEHEDYKCPTCHDSGIVINGDRVYTCPDCIDLDQIELKPWNPDEPEENQHEGLSFDKFMDDILMKESKARLLERADTPQRVYNKKYRETPANRTRFGNK